MRAALTQVPRPGEHESASVRTARPSECSRTSLALVQSFDDDRPCTAERARHAASRKAGEKIFKSTSGKSKGVRCVGTCIAVMAGGALLVRPRDDFDSPRARSDSYRQREHDDLRGSFQSVLSGRGARSGALSSPSVQGIVVQFDNMILLWKLLSKIWIVDCILKPYEDRRVTISTSSTSSLLQNDPLVFGVSDLQLYDVFRGRPFSTGFPANFQFSQKTSCRGVFIFRKSLFPSLSTRFRICKSPLRRSWWYPCTLCTRGYFAEICVLPIFSHISLLGGGRPESKSCPFLAGVSAPPCFAKMVLVLVGAI